PRFVISTPGSIGKIDEPARPWNRRSIYRSAARNFMEWTRGVVVVNPEPMQKTLFLFLFPLLLQAQQSWEEMDFGPFLQSSVTMPWSTDGEELDGITLKGITVKLDHGASICFDTDLLRYAGGWTDGWLKLMGTPFDGTHRPPERSRPAVTGQLVFGSGPIPGGSITGKFNDPRAEPYGPLPSTQAKYQGLYLQGNRVAFAYRLGDCSILEAPQAVQQDGQVLFTRTLHLSPSKETLSLLVCDLRNDFGHGKGFDGRPAIDNGRIQILGDLTAGVSELFGGHWRVSMGRRLILTLPPSTEERVCKIVLGKVSAETLLKELDQSLEDPRAFKKAGATRFPDVVKTHGSRGSEDDAFAVDTLTLPDANPWKAWLKVGGFDFFADGKRAAISTWAGDVWTVDGIDDALEELRWRRFATGLFQPLGLKIVDDTIYVSGRDQITRLHDTNGDGEADFYENFNNDVCATPNFHEFVFGLETDPDGNFYFSKGAPLMGTQYYDPISRHNGCMLRVSADGKKLDRFATGLRAPNGIGVGPDGQVTSGDNEGIWTPVCRINWMKEGGFYGCHGMSHDFPPPAAYEPPLCWLPFAVDNSTGGQVWVPKGTWGELGGELLHISYGQCALFHVLKQEVDGVMQGGVVRFPMSFNSGIMRGRFNAKDGHLYLAGLRGWQTRSATDGGLQRVRKTAKPMKRLIGLRVEKEGFELKFSTPLDRAIAEDLGSYTVKQWNYRWSEQYGSDLYSVDRPGEVLGKKGELKGDTVQLISATLLPDGQRVRLKTAALKVAMQIAITFDLEDTEGHELIQEYYGTINRLPR
ncbi:MAG: hypothetical protein ACI9QL_005178, partial [Candidatus Omnitrophota bacterium]